MKTKGDTTLEAVDMTTFFKLKARTKALHLITSKHPGEKSVKTLFGYSSELKSACGVVPQKRSYEI